MELYLKSGGWRRRRRQCLLQIVQTTGPWAERRPELILTDGRQAHGHGERVRRLTSQRAPNVRTRATRPSAGPVGLLARRQVRRRRPRGRALAGGRRGGRRGGGLAPGYVDADVGLSSRRPVGLEAVRAGRLPAQARLELPGERLGAGEALQQLSFQFRIHCLQCLVLGIIRLE